MSWNRLPPRGTVVSPEKWADYRSPAEVPWHYKHPRTGEWCLMLLLDPQRMDQLTSEDAPRPVPRHRANPDGLTPADILAIEPHVEIFEDDTLAHAGREPRISDRECARRYLAAKMRFMGRKAARRDDGLPQGDYRRGRRLIEQAILDGLLGEAP